MRQTVKPQVLLVITVVVLAVVLIAWMTGRDRQGAKPSPDQVLVVHCGNSMRSAAEEIASIFLERCGMRVEFSYGGSEALLPQILARREGDIFITHDPFGDLIDKEGLLAELATVGHLVPVIIVPKGNPKGIENLDSILKPGLRIGVTDPRFTTAGEMAQQKVLKRTGKSLDDHPNFVLHARTHGDVAVALSTGQLDAGIVWNFVGVQFSDKVDVIPIDEQFPDTRVTVCRLNCAENVEAAKSFLEFASSEEGRKVFTDHGYFRASD